MKKMSILMVTLLSSNAFAAKAQTPDYDRAASYKAEHSVVAESTIRSDNSGVFSDAMLKRVAASAATPKILSVEAVGGMAGIGFAGY